MLAAPKESGFDFDSYISERTKEFSGREWVFERIHKWFCCPESSRFLLLTGDPGSGKTALAARLVEFSRGVVTPPTSCHAFYPGFISAVHFCVARAGSWIDPLSFTRSISLKLADCCQPFAVALKDAGERSISIHVTQQVNQATTVKGVVIENLTLSGLNPQTAFTTAVASPLEEIYRQGFNGSITIVVDGLDEALAHKGDITIVKLLSALGNIPPNIRFILTSRRAAAVENEFLHAENFFLSSEENTHANQQDMLVFVQKSLGTSAPVESVQAIAGKAEGNFQYATFVLDAVPHGRANLMAGLPAGLDSLYLESLRRVIGSHDWSHDYAPIMGLLSVAHESLTDTQLKNFSGLNKRETSDRLTDLRQFIEQTGPPPAYRIYHQSVVDFLKVSELKVSGVTLKNQFFLPPGEWHERVAAYYFSNGTPTWARWDSYGLRYTSAHLAAAAREESNGNRHILVHRLVGLAIDPNYRTRHLAELDDLPALLHDLTEAIRCAALDQEGVLQLVQSALALLAFRDEELRPQALFDLAATGEIERAARRLEIFDLDEDWARVAQLMIAWLGARANQSGARSLLEKISAPPGSSKRLFDLVQASIEHFTYPLPEFPLDSPRSESEVAAVVDWFGGKGSDPEMLQRIADDSFIARGLQAGATPGYFAAQDAPVLVAFAASHPPDGDRYLRQYLAIHSGYQYVQYRNRSLWIILENVLRHPNPEWVRDMVRELATTALVGSSLEFREALPLTVLALQAARRKQDALQALQRLRGQAIAEAATVPDGPAVSGIALNWRYQAGGGTGAAQSGDDSWGSHRRRMAAHAQILALLEGDRGRANELLIGAAHLARGFAGFQAPVYLMLAETFLICNLSRLPTLQTFLDTALQAAHNVQDASFCLRVTSRCNAMIRRWWQPKPPNLRESIRLLVDNPGAPELTALHYVGDKYVHRGTTGLALPDEVRSASTLNAIATIYHRPLVDLKRVNDGLDTSAPLPLGTPVNIPDPGFATWIAARLSAEAVVENGDGQKLLELMQLLVPIATPNPTILDLIMARLLLLMRPADAVLLDALELVVGPPIIRSTVAFGGKLPA